MNWSNSWNNVHVVATDVSSETVAELVIPWRKSVVEHKTVAAIIIGDLAVHEELDVSEEQWQLTHVPTLTRFSALPEGNFSRENLIIWCEQVQLQLPDDWAILRTLTNETYASEAWNIVAAKSRIFAMCGQIPIREEE